MKLADLLDELRNNILHDRSAQTGGPNPDYLWSDKTLIRYINEAQRQFARRSYVIRDGSTPEVVNITIKTGVSTYPLHQSVLEVISAKISTNQVDLVRTGHTALGQFQPINSVIWDVNQFSTSVPGKTLAFTTDEDLTEDDNGSRGAMLMRLFPVPDASMNGQIIQMRVVRLPLDDLILTNLEAQPELPTEHHIEMLDWAAYLALRIVDHDGGDPQRAQEFAASFDANVRLARAMVLRKLNAPRLLGFGKSGWSW